MLRRPSQSDWNRFESGARSRIDKIVNAYAAEKIDEKQFGDRMLSLLEDRHARAGFLGRQRSGDLAPFDEDDRRFGQLIADEESEFLDAFVSDLAAGRYRGAKGDLLTDQVRTRAQMYAGRLLGTANEAFAGTAEPTELIYWRLGGAEEHCGECPDLAAGSPYRADSLPTYPRGNQTPCLFACRCFLERSDGTIGFKSSD